MVQSETEVLYLIRAPKINQVQEIYERVCNVAHGAAMMTGTECEIVFNKACSNYIPNGTLETLLYHNFKEVGVPELDDEEKKFAKDIKKTLSATDINNDLQMATEFTGGKTQKIVNALKEKDISDIILPYVYSSTLLSGSTDVGDVSWIIPTAQFSVACNAFGTPAHSWQSVAQGATTFAHKGMLVAGKVLARTVVDVLLNPAIVEKAKEELRGILDGTAYVCPIPSDVKPSAIK